MRIALLLSLLFLFGCTVTKRVHRPGFHVEWKKNYSISASASVIEKDKAQEASARSTSPSDSKISPNQLDQHDEVLLDSEKHEIVESDDSGLLKSAKNHREGLKEIPKNKKLLFDFSRNSTYRPQDILEEEDENAEAKGMVLRGFAIGLIICGGLIFIASMFLVFGFTGLGFLFDALVFSGNGFLVGLMGFLLFLVFVLIIGLFVVIVEYVLGGPMAGFIVGTVFMVTGLVMLLIAYVLYQ